jgi:predicted NACHT family NTPase
MLLATSIGTRPLLYLKRSKKTFEQEPQYIDLRWAKQEEHLSSHQPKFRDAVAELAATLHGRPKDEITGEDVRQHKRTKKILWSAVMALLTLTVASVVAFLIPFHQYRLADERGQIALSRQQAAQARAVMDSKLDLALLLSVEGWHIKPTVEAKGALLTALFKDFRLKSLLHGTGPVYSVAFSPDGKLLASVSKGNILLWDVNSHKLLDPPLNGHTDSVSWLAFSPDRKTLASGSYDSTIRLWDVETHQALGLPLKNHEGKINAVAFSPDGQYLASSGSDGFVKLWDCETRQPLCDLYKGAGGSDALFAFSADNNNIIANEFSGLKVWDVSVDSLLKQACRVANRNLKHTEWQRYLGDLPYHPSCPDLPVPKE